MPNLLDCIAGGLLAPVLTVVVRSKQAGCDHLQQEMRAKTPARQTVRVSNPNSTFIPRQTRRRSARFFSLRFSADNLMSTGVKPRRNAILRLNTKHYHRPEARRISATSGETFITRTHHRLSRIAAKITEKQAKKTIGPGS
ncbi:hypothetical protein MJ579_05075 [Klebsiella pneumoniae]|nr:hypothetical protein MJ579_05075 [Klebsiella pneumoniae]